MRNFAIMFNLSVRVGPKQYNDGGSYKRVIRVQDRQIAEIIARAMLGEEIFVCQYLDAVVSVEETEEVPHVFGLCSEHYTWERVIQRLYLRVAKPLRPICYYDDPQNMICGLELDDNQRRRALSMNL